ncbi:MAG: lysophospholipid acyltransferase family protein [Bacteroidales bacterium]
MKYLAYIIVSANLRLLAILPRPLLYQIANLVSFTLNHLASYRKRIITENLKNAFPEEPDSKIQSIRKKFYRHLADLIIETAMIQYYSRAKLMKMFVFVNPELLEKYYNEGRHVIVMGGHYNNWEWSSPFSITFKHQVIGVYKPLHNSYFDKAYRRTRSRFGADIVPMGGIVKKLFEYSNIKIPTITGMVGDQRPAKKQIQYWTDFLNQKTAMYTGSEKLAKKFDAVVVFIHVGKVRRGTYTATLKLITENPSDAAPNEITEKYTRLLENMILEEPAHWLWSHRRWKFTYEQWLKMNPSAFSTDPLV